jgi:spoIIIJ-associated protein
MSESTTSSEHDDTMDRDPSSGEAAAARPTPGALDTLDEPEVVRGALHANDPQGPAGPTAEPGEADDEAGEDMEPTGFPDDVRGNDDVAAEADSDADEVGGIEEDDEMATGASATAAKPSKGSRARQLEREGEVAADFLETLLDIADLDGDIEVDIDGDRAAVAIVDSEEGRVPRRLVGAQGTVLEALQELTRLAVQTATGERSRLMLDVAGHRAERRAALVKVAQEAIAEVKETSTRKALEDMTAFERKVIHDEVATAGLDSESEGVEPHRHIVILPV